MVINGLNLINQLLWLLFALHLTFFKKTIIICHKLDKIFYIHYFSFYLVMKLPHFIGEGTQGQRNEVHCTTTYVISSKRWSPGLNFAFSDFPAWAPNIFTISIRNNRSSGLKFGRNMFSSCSQTIQFLHELLPSLNLL